MNSSTDANGQPLSYTWTITKQPATNLATLSDPHAARPTFTPGVTGNYTFSLQVSDGVVTGTDPQAFAIAKPQADAVQAPMGAPRDEALAGF